MLIDCDSTNINIKNNAQLTAYDISLASETREIFEKSSRFD